MLGTENELKNEMKQLKAKQSKDSKALQKAMQKLETLSARNVNKKLKRYT